MIWNSQKEKLSNKVLEARGNMIQLYNLVSNLISIPKLSPLPEDTPSEEPADRFADYFIQKIRTIQDSLANFPTLTPTGSSLVEFIWKRK